MDPPRGASRLVRGRARGGGQYRPYFYFRRNGQTVRGGGGNNGNSGNRSRRGRGSFANTARIEVPNSGILPPTIENGLLRATHFAAPHDAYQNVHSIAVETIPECPGWKLYFPRDSYDAASDIAKRIKILEKHFTTNRAAYQLIQNQDKGFFNLDIGVVLNDQEIKSNWPSLVDDMRNRSIRTLSTFGLAMYSVLSVASHRLDDSTTNSQRCDRRIYMPRILHPRKIYVRPYGFQNQITFSEIATEHIDKLITVRGCIVSASGTEYAASWICFRCSRCKQEQSFRQTGNCFSRPYNCKRSDCHAKKGFVETRTSPYTRLRPLQTICIVEQTLEDIEMDQRRKLDVELRHDLVNSFEPGQDVIITGIFKIRALERENERSHHQPLAATNSSHNDEMYLKAMSILDATNIPLQFSDQDMNAFTSINTEADSFKLLVHSIAPEVCGHEMAKAGVVLSLFGGAGTQIHDESEINILLVGDPGAGKSHILQMCSKVSEKGIFLNGKKGISSTGLNTTVQSRSQSSLNFGAFMSSLRGHIAFDDIDKIASQQDLLLQIMQSKGVTLPFPGVFTTQSMHASVIASANSARGHYNSSKLLADNVRISPALISQFHLIFILSDKPNKELDMSFTDHVHKLHAGAQKPTAIANRYLLKSRGDSSFASSVVNIDGDSDDDDDRAVDENYNLQERLKLSAIEEAEIDLLPLNLIKKYMVYARQKCKPLLKPSAMEAIKKFYMEMKQVKDEEKSSGINSSQLMGLIRLSQARARVNFSEEVTKVHVRDVLCIVRHCMDDMLVGDYVDLDRSTTKQSMAVGVRKFLKVLQLKSNALNRRTFELDELKEMAHQVGITSNILSIIDAVNLQGFLLKKGSNIYEVTES